MTPKTLLKPFPVESQPKSEAADGVGRFGWSSHLLRCLHFEGLAYLNERYLPGVIVLSQSEAGAWRRGRSES